ncbi:MBL fold metallo-hydrolase, partial [Cylindrospermopsis raciborskii CS-506_B]
MTMTRRSLMTAVALGAAASPAAFPALAATPLSWQVLQGAPTSFGKTSVLLTGQRDALLVDGMFTLAEGRMAVEAIRASGKRLTTVFVSHGDPDYYFSLEVVRAAFPAARFVATASTVAHINVTMAKKLEVWGPRMGENAPRSPFVPEVLTGSTLALEDEVLEVVTPE